MPPRVLVLDTACDGFAVGTVCREELSDSLKIAANLSHKAHIHGIHMKSYELRYAQNEVHEVLSNNRHSTAHFLAK